MSSLEIIALKQKINNQIQYKLKCAKEALNLLAIAVHSFSLNSMYSSQKLGIKRSIEPRLLSESSSSHTNTQLSINIQSTNLYKANSLYYLLSVTLYGYEKYTHHHLKLYSISSPNIIQHTTQPIVDSDTNSLTLNLWIELPSISDHTIYLFLQSKDGAELILLQRILLSDIIQLTKCTHQFYDSKSYTLINQSENHHFLDTLYKIGFISNDQLNTYNNPSFTTRIATTNYIGKRFYSIQYTCKQEFEFIIFLFEKNQMGRIEQTLTYDFNPMGIESTHEKSWLTKDEIQIIENIEKEFIKTSTFCREVDCEIERVESNKRILLQLIE